MIPSLYIGIAGMCLILFAFVSDLFHFIDQDNIFYILLNLIGSGMMTYYAYAIDSIPFLILNAVWCVASVYDLIRINVNKKK